MLWSQEKGTMAGSGAGGHSSGRTADHSGFRPDRRGLAVLTARLLAVASVALVLGPPPATSGETETETELFEHAVKAAYAYNFVKLVTWPESPLSRTPTLYICVLDDDYLADALDRTVRDNRSRASPWAWDGSGASTRSCRAQCCSSTAGPLRSCHRSSSSFGVGPCSP